MNDKLNNNVTIIPPFKKFCMTIGELPSSYTESMTYYESLVWLCNYIGNTLIPAINNNGEAVTELQEKYVELKNYVDNYFENLDVQEEINNKLDDMAESGELVEIISAYLEISSILGFDTKADLKAADNLINGSITRTLGTDAYDDGYGYIYKIRELEESDVIDEDNLVALTNYPLLVAEKLINYNATKDITTSVLQDESIISFDTLDDLKDSTIISEGTICKTLGTNAYDDGYGYFYKIREKGVGEIPDEDNVVSLDISASLVAEKIINYGAIKDVAISATQQEDYMTIFVGDSYGSIQNNNWVIKYCAMKGLTLGTNALNLCVASAGFHDELGGNNTYLNNLINGTNSIDKTKVGKIIVCGGWNDRQLSDVQLATYTSAFMTYVKANFPNAKVYCGMIANNGAIDPYLGSDVNWRDWLIRYTLNGYKTIENYGGIYLNGVECVLHKYSLFNTNDYVHPNSDGSDALGEAIYHSVESGNYCVPSGGYEGVTLSNTSITLNSNLNTSTQVNMYGYIQNNNINLVISGTVKFTNNKQIAETDEYIEIEIGEYAETLARFRYCNYVSEYPVKARASFYTSTKKPTYDCIIYFNRNGKIILRLFNSYPISDYITELRLIGYTTKPVLCI